MKMILVSDSGRIRDTSIRRFVVYDVLATDLIGFDGLAILEV